MFNVCPGGGRRRWSTVAPTRSCFVWLQIRPSRRNPSDRDRRARLAAILVLHEAAVGARYMYCTLYDMHPGIATTSFALRPPPFRLPALQTSSTPLRHQPPPRLCLYSAWDQGKATVHVPGTGNLDPAPGTPHPWFRFGDTQLTQLHNDSDFHVKGVATYPLSRHRTPEFGCIVGDKSISAQTRAPICHPPARCC